MPDMEFPSPEPNRVATPRWLDPRLVFGIVLVLAAVLVGALVVARARHTDKELAVKRNLAAGTTLRADDVEAVDAQLPDTAHVYVRDRAKVVGKVLDRPLARGELVPSAALGSAPPRTTVSVPFAADAAPKLSRGQRIVVWLSTKSCPSVVLLDDVTVQDVHAADAGSFASGGAGQDVVLSVSPALAQRVNSALALDGVTIRAGVLTGGSRVAARSLPALASCGATPSP
jgi:SAF domain-containing protein